MGAVRATGGGLLSLAGDALSNGVATSLQQRGLGHLIGRPALEVFVGLVDYVCAPGGPIDEGISRQAMLVAVKDRLDAGTVDFNDITPAVLKELFLDFVICSIEGKLISDIGSNGLKVPDTVDGAIEVERQVRDFIAGATRTHVGELMDSTLLSINQGKVNEKITQIYELAYGLLDKAGEAAE
jgi:hypothetical protein